MSKKYIIVLVAIAALVAIYFLAGSRNGASQTAGGGGVVAPNETCAATCGERDLSAPDYDACVRECMN
ncbi:MAG: hypothetical protein Q7R94_00605 [bacterium]|nr:hypothetical protein [bacterium]